MRSHLDAICVLFLISPLALMPGRSAGQAPDAPPPQAGIEGRLLLDPEVSTDRLWVRVMESGRHLGTRLGKALARVPVEAGGRFRASELQPGVVHLVLETTGDYRFPFLQADVQLEAGATRQLGDIDLRGRIACFVVRMQDPAGTAISAATLHAASSPRTFAPFVVPTDGGVAVLTRIGDERLRYWADARGFHGRWIEDVSSDLAVTLEPVPILRLHVGALSSGTRLTLTPLRDGVPPGAEEPGTLEGRTGEEDVIEVEIERQGLYCLDVGERRQDGGKSGSRAAARRRFRSVHCALPRVIELRGPLTEVSVGWGRAPRSAGVQGDTARLEGRLLLDPGVPTEDLRLWVAVASKYARPVTRRVPPLALIAIDAEGRFRVSGLPAGTVDLALEAPADYRFHVLARGLGLWPGVTIRIPEMDVRGRVHSCRVSVQDPEGKPIPGATIAAANLNRWLHSSFDASSGPVSLVSAADPPKLVADALGFRAEKIPFGAPELTLVLQPLPLVRLRFDSSLFGSEAEWRNLSARLTRVGDLPAPGEDSAAEPAQESDRSQDFEVESEGRYRLRLSTFHPGSSLPLKLPIPVRPEVIDVRGPLTEVRVTRVEAEHR